jgi:hypothetical protein
MISATTIPKFQGTGGDSITAIVGGQGGLPFNRNQLAVPVLVGKPLMGSAVSVLRCARRTRTLLAADEANSLRMSSECAPIHSLSPANAGGAAGTEHVSCMG